MGLVRRRRGVFENREIDIMDIVAETKYVKMSPTKARHIARELQGKKVSEALAVVDFNKCKAGALIGKTLRSAIANAENNEDLAADDLFVKTAVVNKGPVMKRFWPRARGMVSPIKRKTSHIRIVLSD